MNVESFENNQEQEEQFEITPEVIAEACKKVLSQDQLGDITAQEDTGGALEVAFAHLLEEGEEPEEFLIEKGVLE